uniref:G-protein coupled receptors family 1 profile domain-containing protein n=1 Tax=Capitella teleta TaxID=283909 RepID=X1ZZA9_CAPTE
MDSSTSLLQTLTAATNIEVDYTKPWYPWLIVVFEVLCVLNAVGNVLVIIAFVKSEQLQTPTNLLICNHCLMDASMSLAGQPFIWLTFTQRGIIGTMNIKYLCLGGMGIARISSLGSILGILLLTVERSIAIFCPYRYYTVVTHASIKRVIVCFWSFCILISCLPMLGWNNWQPGLRCNALNFSSKIYNMYMFTAFCFICLVVAAILNICMAMVAVKKNRVQDSNSEESGHIKVMKMLLKVVGVFYLCRMPHLVITTVYSITPVEEREELPDWFMAVFDFAKVFIGLNAVFNPLIYVRSSEQFMDAFKRLWKIDNRVNTC